jgi:hypothetical protein
MIKPHAAAERVWSITDGRKAIGTIEQRGEGQYVVILPNHSIVGTFTTFDAAMAVLNKQRRAETP